MNKSSIKRKLLKSYNEIAELMDWDESINLTHLIKEQKELLDCGVEDTNYAFWLGRYMGFLDCEKLNKQLTTSKD